MSAINMPDFVSPPSTVISFMPFDLNELKPDLIPAYFSIPKPERGDFSTLLVKECVARLYVDENRGTIMVPQHSNKIAESICTDYINAQLGAERFIAEPALFWVSGDHTDKETAKIELVEKMEEALERQKTWFQRLIKMGDNWWNTKRNHHGISDTMRAAAKELGHVAEWTRVDNIEQLKNINCPSCRMLVADLTIVCPSCRYILRPEAHDASRYVNG